MFNSRRNIGRSIGKVFAVVLLSCLFPFNNLAASDQPIKIRVASHIPPTHPWEICSSARWLEAVDRIGKGQVKVDFHPSGSLLTDRDLLDGVRKGVTDIALLFIDYWPDRFKVASFCSLPYIWPDPETATVITRDLMKGPLGKEFRNEGVEPVMILYTTFRHLYLTKDKVHSLKDLKGLKLRSMGWEAKTFEALGASAVFMGPSEATTALKTGVIDGGAQVYYGMTGWGLTDITKEVFELRGHYISFGLWGANMKKWKNWPENVRQIIVQASKEVESQWITCQDEFDRKAKEQFKNKNVPIYILTDEELQQAKKLTAPVFDEWLQEVGDVGKEIFKEYNKLLKQHSKK